MKLLRLRMATAFLRGAGFVADVIAGPDPATIRSHRKVECTPAGYILLASLTGLAICIFWIWINGRAWR